MDRSRYVCPCIWLVLQILDAALVELSAYPPDTVAVFEFRQSEPASTISCSYMVCFQARFIGSARLRCRPSPELITRRKRQ